MDKAALDKVFIEGLEIEALIGIYDWERRISQPLVFDLEMVFDNRIPAASDAIQDTLNYKAVSKRLIQFVSQSDFGLVETLAERCAAIILDEFGVQQLRLKLSKPGAVRGARAVGVLIERSREPARAREVQVAPRNKDHDIPTATLSPTLPPAAAPVAKSKASRQKPATATARAYLSLGSNVEPERNLRAALVALRARFGNVVVSPVYLTRSVGFDGPDFLNAIAVLDSDLHPFALNDWVHAQEAAQGRDRRDASYSNRSLDIDIIYFGDLILDGPGELQLPRPELRHAFVLKPLADVAPDFVDPIRSVTLAQLWAVHPEHDSPPPCVALDL